MKQHTIRIKGASQNNLKSIDLELPHYQLIAVTGVSGSGKSSLAFDVIAQEGRRQFLESIPSFARQFTGKINRAKVDELSGLFPVITLPQKISNSRPNSTVGTLSEVYDLLRILYARFGKAPESIKPTRSLFSFNRPEGACATCNGLGKEEKIDLNKLVADPNLSLREGALVPTLPNGYIMYSQVTVDVLNTVCQQHGFSVDIPWKDLTDEQREVILYGSDKLKVPFGKHSIESRLKWTGMKAKPREEGFYKGMMPIMQDILKRDRNKNILKFVSSVTCSSCHGHRLNEEARTVLYRQKSIVELSNFSLTELLEFVQQRTNEPIEQAEKILLLKLMAQLDSICSLGNGHLHLAQPATELTNGEIQRLRLVNLLATDMSHVLYVFDEPSIGLHPKHRQYLIQLMKELVAKNNTVLLVEHDPALLLQADWLVDIGPKAGIEGGKILYNGPLSNYLITNASTPTYKALQKQWSNNKPETSQQFYKIHLPDVTLQLKQQAINILTGEPCAGIHQLLHECLLPTVENWIEIDQKPIGRTPRSNPATYTGLADHIRDLFAALPDAKAAGYKKGRFSFNNKGGRCDTCEGAGKIQIGMHYMGQVDLICPTCSGKRFNDATLSILYKGYSIAEVYNMSVNKALDVFSDVPKILQYLNQLKNLGLGYLQLGQSSTTLSGGEAQRIKLATHLVKKMPDNSWFVLNEPTIGLHHQDVEILLAALKKLNENGHTVVCTEFREQFIALSDWVVELGNCPPMSLLFQGNYKEFQRSTTPTAVAFAKEIKVEQYPKSIHDNIQIKGAQTHHLKNVSVDLPINQITVVTGLSGSGKSSLIMDTLYAHAHTKFRESMSAYTRGFIQQGNRARALHFENVTPSISISRKSMRSSARSTVGTLSGIYEKYRFLFSRIAQLEKIPLTAQHFSFNHELGACQTCSGLGEVLKADPYQMALDWSTSILEGAFTTNAAMSYYGNPEGQYIAILKEVAMAHCIDLTAPLKMLTKEQMNVVMYGTGSREWETLWKFRTKTRSGEQKVRMQWKGLSNLIEKEYLAKANNKNNEKLRQLLSPVTCKTCNGGRLTSEALSIKIAKTTIDDLSRLSINDSINWFENNSDSSSQGTIVEEIFDRIHPILKTMQQLGLGYLSIQRTAHTLSGGEGQRLRLAQQLSSSLSGITYLLDEPTIGLHPKNTLQLIDCLRQLKEKGNTVVIIEHDPQVIQSADYLIEMGPKSGKDGGTILAQGNLKQFTTNKNAITPKYLNQEKIKRPIPSNKISNAFGVKGANKFTLNKVDAMFSSNAITVIVGESGAGKSTLINDILYPSLVHNSPVHCDSIVQNVTFDKIVHINQFELSTKRNETIASILGILDLLQTIFASLPEAKTNQQKKSTFNYLHKDGRCPNCNGQGEVKTSLDLLDDVWTTCETCDGVRFRPSSLIVKWNNKHLAELLEMSIHSLHEWLQVSNHKKAKQLIERITPLLNYNLGHLTSNQATSSLSGGEAQRLKLLKALSNTTPHPTLFLIDEPSSGLHLKDQEQLMNIFYSIVDQGHTILFIEHSTYMIDRAHEVIELTASRK